jgi:nucleoid-associated protein YgaU
MDLGKQIGPLPLGAWAVVVAGGLGIAWYTRQNGAGAPAAAADTGGVDSNVGDGSVGGWTPTGPVSTTTSPVSTAPTTNEEWGQQAINWLIGQNYDANLSDSAIRSYLSGVKLSASQYTLVGLALIHLGSPPTPLPVGDDSGTPPVKTPIPGGSTKPPTSTPIGNKPPVTTKPKPVPSSGHYKAKYTVQHGDNLWNIAKRYYGSGIKWGTIYNANKRGVKRLDGSVGMIANPSLIQPGWVLIIP